MIDNWIMLVIGGVMIFASFAMTAVASGLPPSKPEYPKYPVPTRLRIVFFVIGIFAVVLAVLRLIRGYS